MALDSYRNNATPLLEKISKPFMRFNPNSITIVSFILALLAGIVIALAGRLFSFYYDGLAFALILLSSTLDAVDGFVARKRNISSRSGDMLDHTFDRYSDIALITGFSFSIFGNVYLGMLALGGVFMTSYLGTQSQALGLKRNYGGLLGRADRLAIMLVIILVELAFPFNLKFLIQITPVNLMLLWFLIAGYITSVERFSKSLKGLKEME
ncbi:MAG: CDP-alcohol phosphatidyltransferase family protein [Cuniculiplasma sp.]